MLPIVGNIIYSGNAILSGVVSMLATKLPAGWQSKPARVSKRDTAECGSVDMVLKIRRPGMPAGLVLVAARARLEPRGVDYLAAVLRCTQKRPVLIAAPFISPRTQERLRACGFAYADLTGNVWLSLSEPGLFIETMGADENPEPDRRGRKSLKGPKAGRIVRALCDFRPPIRLRELARRSGVDPGYTSRVVDYLNREALITRSRRGPVVSVDWPALLKRWSQEYSPFQRKRVMMCLAPRGVAAAIERLKILTLRFAVSGSWAAVQLAPVAPTRLLLVYADQPMALVEGMDLRPTEAGANVAVAVPFDPVVYERTSRKDGINVVAPSQIVADLLTSPGRGPNEADALIAWMGEHEELWRA